MAALAHHAAQLGVITRAANCHERVEVAADGTTTTIKCRNSSSLSPTAKAQHRNREGIQKKPTLTKHDAQLDRLIQRLVQQPSVGAEPTLSEERQARKRKQAALARADQRLTLEELALAQAAAATPPLVAATDRITALRARVLAKRPAGSSGQAECTATLGSGQDCEQPQRQRQQYRVSAADSPLACSLLRRRPASLPPRYLSRPTRLDSRAPTSSASSTAAAIRQLLQ